MGKTQNLKLKSDTTLKENENEIKQLFDINKKVKLQYRTSTDDDLCGEKIEDENTKLEVFGDKTVKILYFTKASDYDVAKPGETIYKYFYQTNQDGKTVYTIELNSEATVKDLKKVIAVENNVRNLYDIKILFAGKDLLNRLTLKSLKIGTTILSVYIRSQEDILLMTAKALIVNLDSDEEEESTSYD